MTEPQEKVFKGWLSIRNVEEPEHEYILEAQALHLDNVPFTETLEEFTGKVVSIRYYCSDKEISLEEAQEAFVNHLVGRSFIRFSIHFSELSGFLWMDEDFRIGGHDYLQEMKGHIGKYLILIIRKEETPNGGTPDQLDQYPGQSYLVFQSLQP